jgi:hypothetical protein
MNIKIGMSVVLKDGRFLRVTSDDGAGRKFSGLPHLSEVYEEFDEASVLGVVEFVQHSDPLRQKLIDMQNNRLKHSLVVQRTGEPQTLAILSFTANERLEPQMVLAALTSAVTRWIIRTMEGKDAWVSSSQNFNIGDLMMNQESATLRAEIAAAGLFDFSARSCGGENFASWTYDTVLADADKIHESRSLEPKYQPEPVTVAEEAVEELDEEIQWDTGRSKDA